MLASYNTPTCPERPETAVLSFLSLLQEVEGEIEAAKQAVVEGRLPAFETSLRKQAALCSRLGDLYPHLFAHCEPSARLRVQHACTQALHTNRSYAALVQQAQGTNAVLLALSASYRKDQEHMGRRSVSGQEGLLCTA